MSSRLFVCVASGQRQAERTRRKKKKKRKVKFPAPKLDKMGNAEALVFAIAVCISIATLLCASQANAVAPPPPPTSSAQADKLQQVGAAANQHPSPQRQRGGTALQAASSSQQRPSENIARSHLPVRSKQQVVAATTTTTTTTAAPPTSRSYSNHRNEDLSAEATTLSSDVEDLAAAASSSGQPQPSSSAELSEGEVDDSSGESPTATSADGSGADEAADDFVDQPTTATAELTANEGLETRVGVAAGPVRREQHTTTGRPEQSTRLTRQPSLITSTVASSLNVDMGADRMMIKPPDEGGGGGGMRSSLELASEPRAPQNHVLLSSRDAPQSRADAINERRQNMLFPQGGGGHLDEFGGNTNEMQNAYANQASQHEQQSLLVAGICYTPLALLMVILITMAVTVAVCFCAYFLIKHLGRRQFGKCRFNLIARLNEFQSSLPRLLAPLLRNPL